MVVVTSGCCGRRSVPQALIQPVRYVPGSCLWCCGLPQLPGQQLPARLGAAAAAKKVAVALGAAVAGRRHTARHRRALEIDLINYKFNKGFSGA